MKSKLITTMMTVLFLAFAVIAPPLLSVPIVSASTLKVTVEEWCSDYPSFIYDIYSKANVPIEYIPLDYQNMPSKYLPYNPLDYLMWVGYIKGDISAMVYAFIDPHGWEQNKINHAHVLHWEQDQIWVFDDDRDGVFDDGWVTIWVKGVLGKDIPCGSFVCESATWEGMVTHASPDKTNYIGCKVGGKGTATWVTGDPSYELGCPWFYDNTDPPEPIPAWGYAEGTGHMSGSLNK